MGRTAMEKFLANIKRLIVSAWSWLGERSVPGKYWAWALVALLHLGVIWLLSTGFALPPGWGPSGPELRVSLVGAPSVAPRPDPPPEPEMQAVDTTGPAVEAPQIDVEITPPAGQTGITQADILPPRPDPAFLNASPSMPSGHAKAIPVEVMLTILVAADGSVRDARVAKSSGEAMLDQLAMAFTKAKWRFRAALQAGHPVQDWTTVLVRFAPAG
jgi:TonB family protein